MRMRPPRGRGEGGTMGLNLATILRQSARSQPDKALISGVARVTYADVDAVFGPVGGEQDREAGALRWTA